MANQKSGKECVSSPATLIALPLWVLRSHPHSYPKVLGRFHKLPRTPRRSWLFSNLPWDPRVTILWNATPLKELQCFIKFRVAQTISFLIHDLFIAVYMRWKVNDLTQTYSCSKVSSGATLQCSLWIGDLCTRRWQNEHCLPDPASCKYSFESPRSCPWLRIWHCASILCSPWQSRHPPTSSQAHGQRHQQSLHQVW